MSILPYDFDQIVHDYERKLFGFARRVVGNPQDAEEIVQDALVRAYRALNAMKVDQRDELRLGPWLYTITLNVARNKLRRKHIVSVSLDASEDPDWLLPPSSAETPEFFVEQRERFKLVEDALAHLPWRMRCTARLRFIEGHTYPEIAKMFHQPVGTVKSNVHRARLILRRIIAEELYAA
jgi:RNA polymerase sigma-70 factor, ECF subfamily